MQLACRWSLLFFGSRSKFNMENNMGKKRVGPRWLTETELKRVLDDLHPLDWHKEECI